MYMCICESLEAFLIWLHEPTTHVLLFNVKTSVVLYIYILFLWIIIHSMNILPNSVSMECTYVQYEKACDLISCFSPSGAKICKLVHDRVPFKSTISVWYIFRYHSKKLFLSLCSAINSVILYCICIFSNWTSTCAK
jgi:hypothetical protein